jgi:hypothetical protein
MKCSEMIIKYKMPKLILIRKYKIDSTQGLYLVMDGVTELYRCFCMELPWLNNEHNISCIPSGVYDVIKYSYKGHPNVFWIKDVPGREGIMIHIGNFLKDTLGCQIPGTDWMDIDGNGTIDIVHPDIALQNLNKYLPSNFKLYII